MNASNAAVRMRSRTPAMSSRSSPLDIGTVWYHTNGQMVPIGTVRRPDCLQRRQSMTKPRILVTGATGKTGSLVVAESLEAGYPVRAMVHREDARSARLKALGAEIAVAEMSDVERVADALKDVQRAYFCPPFDPY